AFRDAVVRILDDVAGFGLNDKAGFRNLELRFDPSCTRLAIGRERRTIDARQNTQFFEDGNDAAPFLLCQFAQFWRAGWSFDWWSGFVLVEWAVSWIAAELLEFGWRWSSSPHSPPPLCEVTSTKLRPSDSSVAAFAVYASQRRMITSTNFG